MFNVYFSGEIHTDWREQIIQACKTRSLAIEFTSAVTDHDASDTAGNVLGAEKNTFWRDHKSAKVNAIRTKKLLEECDVAIIRFGDKYKQWNAAFEAGYCAALAKPYITFHDESLIHPLKEVDSAAHAWTSTIGQVVDLLVYIVREK